MEIKIGNCEFSADNLKTALDYRKCVQTITKGLFFVSGMPENVDQICAFSENLHRFLVENKDFVVGIVNAGKIKL